MLAVQLPLAALDKVTTSFLSVNYNIFSQCRDFSVMTIIHMLIR